MVLLRHLEGKRRAQRDQLDGIMNMVTTSRRRSSEDPSVPPAGWFRAASSVNRWSGWSASVEQTGGLIVAADDGEGQVSVLWNLVAVPRLLERRDQLAKRQVPERAQSLMPDKRRGATVEGPKRVSTCVDAREEQEHSCAWLRNGMCVKDTGVGIDDLW
ncbi:hypothetical protein NDU88_005540 [Pleurodeles waltl]|uniref:Uncharacterized protein n=1 Tax=Pleurodeles waltl TaxID=8319 RepID=A0AAV7SM60_PLEWA|nr:hypothetical protein NDU88_005540 [Pleurodeles waltl]